MVMFLAGACGSGKCDIPAGTVFNYSVTNDGGNCSSGLVGTLSQPGTATEGSDQMCGVYSSTNTQTLTNVDGAGTDCTVTQVVTVDDLTDNGGSGPYTVDVACTDGSSCHQDMTVTYSKP